MILLKQYSQIFSGFSFRNQLKNNEKGKFGVLTAKDIDLISGTIDHGGIGTAPEFNGPPKYFLKNGDIILNARGGNPRAFIFEREESKPLVIVSGAFIVIRTMEEFLNAGYLAWFINLPESQEALRKLHTGTTVMNLPIAALHDFMIQIPAKNIQRSIGNLYLQNINKIQLTKLRDELHTQLLNENLKSLLK